MQPSVDETTRQIDKGPVENGRFIQDQRRDVTRPLDDLGGVDGDWLGKLLEELAQTFAEGCLSDLCDGEEHGWGRLGLHVEFRWANYASLSPQQRRRRVFNFDVRPANRPAGSDRRVHLDLEVGRGEHGRSECVADRLRGESAVVPPSIARYSRRPPNERIDMEPYKEQLVSLRKRLAELGRHL